MAETQASERDDKGRVDANPALWNKTIELLCDEPEQIRIKSQSFTDAIFADITAPPVRVTQNGSAGDNPHRYHLVLLFEGQGTYHWAGGTGTQVPGDIVLIDTAEPSQVVSPIRSHLVRWSFPERLIAPFLPLRDNRPVLHIAAREGLITVLTCHIKQLANEVDRLDPAVQQGLLAHLCGLLGLAIEAEKTPRAERRCNYRTFQRQRVLTYLETNLSDCHLTARRAAKDLGMSPRWLHALLEDVGSGFPDLVARRRLEKSLGLLKNPASDHLSIAEIAFLSGFNDLSTFYRRFGEYYNMTPGETRRMQRQAA
ncbi:AraC family transcriptional regulator [Chelativorans salis]|uniref:Helix-turn-helix transcriptional regulator n=1 Tax=Chelativorans salis TaxID=2978478 RepID=A0ABT2LK07_9HYPH|nr:AraC family transcriptional regulator [Chelativorans sp. EGI FJ00035]MCT7373743.1 helix-turn-helix transcriptional regulator [Chelativorans sp. EGI FJ00035]